MNAFIALQALDLLTTMLGFALGASEASPLIRPFLHVLGPFGAVVIAKLLVTLAMFRLITKRPGTLLFGCGWYGLICSWNIGLLLLLH